MTYVKGIAVPFTFNATGYPATNTDVDLISDSIYTILNTVVGERVYRPTFGSYLTTFIFENLTLATIFRAQSEIRRALSVWEPRVTVNDINFEITNTTELLIHVTWTVNNSITSITTVPITLNTGV